MAVITLSGFTGEQPHIIPRLIPDHAAQSALDVRLDDGGLTAMRMSAKSADAAAVGQKTIFLWNGTWVGWPDVTYAAQGPVATDRLYFMDGIHKPKMRTGGVDYDLALPGPTGALTATASGTGSGDVVTRLYTYTWVTQFGEESEPAPASPSVDWQPGKTVTLGNFGTPPADRGVTSMRIYRSQTGLSGTFYYLIDEEPASTTSYIDSIPPDLLQEPLPSAAYNPPPNTLTGLIALPNGMMAAFKGKDLYFCEPWKPHAWPEKYVLTLDYDIVGLGAMDTSIVVATEGQPYLVSGTTPEGMKAQKIEQNLACINPRSIVDLGYAIAFACREGLVVARANGVIDLATSNIFNRDSWLELSPATMIGCQYQGRYLAYYDTVIAGQAEKGLLIIDVSGKPTFLIRSDIQMTASFFDLLTATMYFQPPNSTEIREFDSPLAMRKRLYWKSKEFVFNAPDNFGAILVDGIAQRTPAEEEAYLAAKQAAIDANTTAITGDIMGAIDAAPMDVVEHGGDTLLDIPQEAMVMTAGVYADKKKVASVSKVNTAVRLPSGFKARTWEIDVATNMQLYTIRMAKTMDQLKS